MVRLDVPASASSEAGPLSRGLMLAGGGFESTSLVALELVAGAADVVGGKAATLAVDGGEAVVDVAATIVEDAVDGVAGAACMACGYCPGELDAVGGAGVDAVATDWLAGLGNRTSGCG